MRLKVSNFGQITEADVEFGDLTIVVGQQASGKTLFLELLKLLYEAKGISRRYEEIFPRTTDEKIKAYFGQGMEGVLTNETRISLDGASVDKTHIWNTGSDDKDDQIFYIPAQRALCFDEGRLKSSTDFTESPEVISLFLRHLTNHIYERASKAEKESNFLKFNGFDNPVFYDAEVGLKKEPKGGSLVMRLNDSVIPYMAWSSGQREFTPLLLALERFKNYGKDKPIIIEEPEMGLHPKAVLEFLLKITTEFLPDRKIIISTHSSVPLEFAWAINNLPANADGYIAELFDGILDGVSGKRILDGISGKKIKVYAFEHNGGKTVVRDISQLNTLSDDKTEAEWGGITNFITRATDLMYQYE